MRLACFGTHLHSAAPVRLRPRVALHGAQCRAAVDRLLACAAAAQQPAQPDNTGSSSSGSSNPAGQQAMRRGSEKDSQPHLQAWLQQQGLSAEAADQHARRLALVFGSQQAALDALPTTFEWCRSRRLTGLQPAQLLDRIASKRQDSAVQFSSQVQPVWQLIDSYIAACVEPLRQAGTKLPKRTSLAEVLCGSRAAAQALGMPPGHVEAWLAAVSKRLPAAATGRLLLAMPHVVSGSPTTALAAMDWAASEMGAGDLAAFFAKAPTLLTRELPTLQHNLDSLQQTLGWTAEEAQQLALKQPVVLTSSPDTVQAALAWLQQLFPDAAQLAGVLGRGARLLSCSVQHLQGNADTLRQALGWQDGDGQLAAFVAAYPQPFAINDLSSEGCAHKLRLLTQVAGVSTEHCLAKGTGYLKTGLETMAAHYMLVQERAPDALYRRGGSVSLSWVSSVDHVARHCCISREQLNAFVREWPRSPEGRRLMEGLRAGSVAGWPRPPVPGAAQQQQWQEAAQRQQARAARKQGTAATMDGKRRGKGRPRKADGCGSGGGDGGAGHSAAAE